MWNYSGIIRAPEWQLRNANAVTAVTHDCLTELPFALQCFLPRCVRQTVVPETLLLLPFLSFRMQPPQLSSDRASELYRKGRQQRLPARKCWPYTQRDKQCKKSLCERMYTTGKFEFPSFKPSKRRVLPFLEDGKSGFCDFRQSVRQLTTRYAKAYIASYFVAVVRTGTVALNAIPGPARKAVGISNAGIVGRLVRSPKSARVGGRAVGSRVSLVDAETRPVRVKETCGFFGPVVRS